MKRTKTAPKDDIYERDKDGIIGEKPEHRLKPGCHTGPLGQYGSPGTGYELDADGSALIETARAALCQPLRFGDAEQIKARKLLSAAEVYREHLRNCHNCREHIECRVGMGTHVDVADAGWALFASESKPDPSGKEAA